jgi:hypothetical protein
MSSNKVARLGGSMNAKIIFGDISLKEELFKRKDHISRFYSVTTLEKTKLNKINTNAKSS